MADLSFEMEFVSPRECRVCASTYTSASVLQTLYSMVVSVAERVQNLGSVAKKGGDSASMYTSLCLYSKPCALWLVVSLR